jgi:Skp family chaperone for outer membrane proteins
VILREAVSDRGLSAISEQENRTVKKTVLTAGGLLALAVLCYAGRSWGQAQPGQPSSSTQAAAAPKTRIALLNLTYVIKNYVKYVNFQKEIQTAIEPFKQKDTELRKRLEELRKKGESAAATEKETLEKEGKELQRKLEDNSVEAKATLGKKSDDEMKILFMDVYEAARRYAVSHEFELVLHYNDAVTPEDFMSPQNIARKLNTGALMPLYAAPGMDISREVVEMLNYNLRPSTASPGGAPASSGSSGQ